jgi:transcription-repair coupling factor (superfamily II helicase)
LQAIKEFTQLGSCFKIAMRDLAIRGAGNLLGGQQHGFISSVGFQMYTQMLSEEIQRRKKEMHGEIVDMVVPVVPTKIDLTIEAYLPSAYIGDSAQKIEMYKRLATVETIAEALHVRTELIDRFGEIPAPVENLLQVTYVRIYGTQQSVQTVSTRGTKLWITWSKEAIRQYDHAQWVAFCLHGDPTLRVIPGAEMTLQFDCEQRTNVAVLQKAAQILQQLDTLRTPSSNTHALPVTTG